MDPNFLENLCPQRHLHKYWYTMILFLMYNYVKLNHRRIRSCGFMRQKGMNAIVNPGIRKANGTLMTHHATPNGRDRRWDERGRDRWGDEWEGRILNFLILCFLDNDGGVLGRSLGGDPALRMKCGLVRGKVWMPCVWITLNCLLKFFCDETCEDKYHQRLMPPHKPNMRAKFIHCQRRQGIQRW